MSLVLDAPPTRDPRIAVGARVAGLDPEALVRGIMWSLRPNVSPWAEPYPGGDW